MRSRGRRFLSGGRERRRAQKTSSLVVCLQQCLHFFPQLLITCTSTVEEQLPVTRLLLQSLLQELVDLLPAFGSHAFSG
jgi:hypothetical protein